MGSAYLMCYTVAVLQDTPLLVIRAIYSSRLNLHTVPHEWETGQERPVLGEMFNGMRSPICRNGESYQNSI
jgi:hypothetical protein